MRSGRLGFVTAIAFGITAAFWQSADVRAQSAGSYPELTPGAPSSSDIPNYPEEMRRLVEKLTKYARGLKSDFIVIVQNNLELLEKTDDMEIGVKAPAKAYARSIDGVLQSPLFFGKEELDETLPEDETEAFLKYTEIAKNAGLKVLVMDHGKKYKTALDAYRQAHKRGYVSFTANAFGPRIGAVPGLIGRPFNENPKSVVSLADVRNYLYLRNTQRFGRQDEFALKIHDYNHDMVVVDIYHGRTPLQRQAVETLKYKKLGARRLAVAYLNIGQASSYHYYWKPDWREGAPTWISAPIPGSPDDYYIQYWDPAWQQILYGSENSYIFGIISQGFDGVVLDGLQTYRYFEGD